MKEKKEDRTVRTTHVILCVSVSVCVSELFLYDLCPEQEVCSILCETGPWYRTCINSYTTCMSSQTSLVHLCFTSFYQFN